MKKALLSISLVCVFTLLLSAVSYGQFKDQETKRSEYSGPIIKKDDPSDGANLGNLFNMKMTHSYSVNFGTFGGQMMNMNAYTNSMQFFFNEDLTGQVNVSLLHSPFGQPNAYDFNKQNSFDVALNAQIDYQINDNMNLHFEVNKYPDSYGYGSAYGRYSNTSPFQYGPIF